MHTDGATGEFDWRGYLGPSSWALVGTEPVAKPFHIRERPDYENSVVDKRYNNLPNVISTCSNLTFCISI